MSGAYVTASRGHDAEWQLQQELRFNDILFQTGRRRLKKGRDRGNQAGMTVPAVTVQEQQEAANRIREIAHRRGVNDTELAELLDMLGVA